MRVLGLITARGGSKGVPGKNIKLLGNKPLIEYSIDFALNNIKIDDELCISTNDEAVIEIAKSKNIKFIRASVGDRYVKEKMQKNNYNLGGEQSGHIILGKFATTGDGLLVALEALFAIRKGKKASSFFNKFKKTPQILENIHVKDKSIIKNSEVKESIKKAEKLMKGYGRILVRESGTESKIRVMGESENKQLLNKCINIILRQIK